MSDPLPPTLRAPLVAGARYLHVEGLVTGWDLEITTFYVALAAVNTLVVPVTYTDPVRLLPSPLVFGTDVQVAHRDPNTGLLASGPRRSVLRADPLKIASRPPRIWPRIHPDAYWAHVSGGVPGYEVEVVRGGLVLGSAIADPEGCANVEVRGFIAAGDLLAARYRLPMAALGAQAQVLDFQLPTPTLASAWAGEPGVWVENVQPGAPAVVVDYTSKALGSQDAPADTRGRAWVTNFRDALGDAALGEGDRLVGSSLGVPSRATRVESSDPCADVDRGLPYLLPLEVSPARPPQLDGPLRVGTQRLRIRGHHPGQRCEVEIYPAGSKLQDIFVGLLTPTQVWAGPTTSSGWLDLPAPLAASVVRVRVQLGFYPPLPGITPDWVRSASRVVGAALQAPEPRALGPLQASALAVQVAHVVAGSEVSVHDADGDYLGFATVDDGPTVRVPTLTLPALERVFAQAAVGSQKPPSVQTTPPSILVGAAPVSPNSPRIVGPVLVGDRRVWVSGVPPGAEVVIRDLATGADIGRVVTADPIVRVPCCTAVIGSVVAQVFGAPGRVAESLPVAPLAKLVPPGPIEDLWFDYGPSPVAPPIGTADAVLLPRIWGRVWAPVVPAETTTLVFILHGVPSFESRLDESCTGLAEDESGTGTNQMSYLGYGELARALARLGCVVVSLKHDAVAMLGDLPARALDTITADPGGLGLATTPVLTDAPTLLIGHSRGGLALGEVLMGDVVPSVWRLTQAVGFVGLAPFWQDQPQPVVTLPVPAIIFCGSADYVLQWDPYLNYHAPAPSEKTFVWVRGATHGSWSSIWSGRDLRLDAPDNIYTGGKLPQIGPLTVDDPVPWQRDVADAATELIVAFARDRLFGETAYRALLRGPVHPVAVEDLGWSIDHTVPVTELVGEFAVTAPALLDWPALPPFTYWDESLAGLPTPLRPDDHLVVRLDVTELDGMMGDQVWAQPVDETRVTTYAALDLLAEIVDGPRRAAVRLGAVAALPGRWGWREDVSHGYPLTLRIPLDAFLGVNPTLSAFPSEVALSLTDLTPDAAAIVDLVALQRL